MQHGKFGFTKGSIIAVILLSLLRTLNRGQKISFKRSSRTIWLLSFA
ncbi:DUF645 family protein [Vibrio cholerae]